MWVFWVDETGQLLHIKNKFLEIAMKESIQNIELLNDLVEGNGNGEKKTKCEDSMLLMKIFGNKACFVALNRYAGALFGLKYLFTTNYIHIHLAWNKLSDIILNLNF